MTDPCLLCRGETVTEIAPVYDNRFGAPGMYAIARCRACGLLQTVPRPAPEALDALYARYYNFGGETSGHAEAYAGFREWLFLSWPYRLWLRLDGDMTFSLVKGTGRLLDVGCNEGRGLVQYRRNGFEAEGQEPNPKPAARARARGFAVSGKSLDDLAAEPPYDVIVLTNVIEHSADPRAMLAAVRRNLRSGGELWLSLPNADSVWRRFFGREWINWHVPYHLSHFDGPRLRRLLAEAGFEVFSFRNESPALWIAQSIIARLYAEPGRPTVRLRRTWLLAMWMVLARGFLFPTLWLFNRAGRGDCLVVRARKA